LEQRGRLRTCAGSGGRGSPTALGSVECTLCLAWLTVGRLIENERARHVSKISQRAELARMPGTGLVP